ncbi:hypothetical protein ACFQ07_22760 [Actinomadura adrarensis]|uniref:Uncharacterized protein n=1 Tax=Actinomadura adrarensis TaxID=1819600 RepID=A0ABW3CKM5_9ACTN
MATVRADGDRAMLSTLDASNVFNAVPLALPPSTYRDFVAAEGSSSQIPLIAIIALALGALGAALSYFIRTRTRRSDHDEVFDGFSTQGRTPARKNPENPDDPDPYGDIESFKH